MSEAYDAVMEPRKNPLQRLPNKTKYQLMVTLSVLWSAVFSISIGSAALFGPTAIIHVAVLMGIFFTFTTFRRAQNEYSEDEDGRRA